jgi:hypothetical protein
LPVFLVRLVGTLPHFIMEPSYFFETFDPIVFEVLSSTGDKLGTALFLQPPNPRDPPAYDDPPYVEGLLLSSDAVFRSAKDAVALTIDPSSPRLRSSSLRPPPHCVLTLHAASSNGKAVIARFRNTQVLGFGKADQVRPPYQRHPTIRTRSYPPS